MAARLSGSLEGSTISARKDPNMKRKPPAPSARAFTDRLELAGGLKVSPVCLGRVGRPGLISEAYDAGINFFFLSADMHWPLYQASRRGLRDLLRRGRGVRDRVVVAVVSYVGQPEFCHVPFLEVVDAVPGLGAIDVTVVGGVYAPDFLVRLAQYRKHRLPDGGPHHLPGVKGTAATFHDRVTALAAVNHRLVDLAFCRYNADHPGAEEDLFPHLGRARGTLLFNFNSTRGYVGQTRWKGLALPGNQWRPAITDYYRFALRQPRIDGLLCGLESRRELEALGAALAAGGVTDEEAAYMRDLADLAAGRRERA
jgi:hypothetical protein